MAFEDDASADAAAAAIAGQVRRHIRRGLQECSPRDQLRLLNRVDRDTRLPDALLAALRRIPDAAAAVLALHMRLHEVCMLPPGILQPVIHHALHNNSGQIEATSLTQPGQLQMTVEDAAAEQPHLLQDLLPYLSQARISHLSIQHRIPQDLVPRLLSSGILLQPTLRTFQLCHSHLSPPAVAQIIFQATSVTALSLTDAIQDPDSAAQQPTAHQADVYLTDPSPGRPDPYPIFQRFTTRLLTPDEEVQAEEVAAAISHLQHLRSLELGPPLTCSSNFWHQLAQHGGLSSLSIAFLEVTPPGGHARPERPASAEHAFAALPSLPALQELQLHGRSYSEEAEQVRLTVHARIEWPPPPLPQRRHVLAVYRIHPSIPAFSPPLPGTGTSTFRPFSLHSRTSHSGDRTALTVRSQ